MWCPALERPCGPRTVWSLRPGLQPRAVRKGSPVRVRQGALRLRPDAGQVASVELVEQHLVVAGIGSGPALAGRVAHALGVFRAAHRRDVEHLTARTASSRRTPPGPAVVPTAREVDPVALVEEHPAVPGEG